MLLPVLFSHAPYLLPILSFIHFIYYRWLHPLAAFPGPFWASQTNIWKAYQLWTKRMPITLQQLHEQYGPVIRIGPNDLNFASEDAVATIYKSGRSMPKSSFYAGFTTFKANLFGTRDEDLHALRRRQMAHGFSAVSLKGMEGIFDFHISELRNAMDRAAASGKPVDLKELIAFYAYDVIGELAFSRDFGTQRSANPANLPPINDHIFLGCMYGMLPSLLPWSMKLTPYIPFPYIQNLIQSRLWLRNTTATCVSAELTRSKSPTGNTEKNLLTQLIAAQDPTTGAKLSHDDIASEAFGFLVAGSHTTSGTLTLLLHHLLHSPAIAAKLTDELSSLPLSRDQEYAYQTLESSLPYTHACIKENYRHTPVFTMPLPRIVTDPHGMLIADHHIPPGTNVSVVNSCVHHNTAIWGDDHDEYIPERWLDEGAKSSKREGALIPFGAGHRACIGRNIAGMSVLKVLVALWTGYVLEPVEVEAGGKELVLRSVGIDEMEGRLMVRVRKREAKGEGE